MAVTDQREMISVELNGEARSVAASSSIAGMLRAFGIDPQRVAVERNLEVVPRSTLDETQVREGDCFEIVHFVGGG